ncbi:MAG: translation initiation factor IF-2 [Candidatus Micrarchaeota archaeon]
MFRQPIVCVLGHVDHGKTSLLDAVRKTKVQAREAGAITQHIGASEVPTVAIRSACGGLLERMKVELTIPGLLFIDTPGHEAFVNLRRRGGSIADIAVLVIDVNQGVQPQTKEAIEILREYKTPFVVAASKVDVITGWIPKRANTCVSDSLALQREDVLARLDELLYRLVGSLSEWGFSSERFDRVSDFTKQVAIIPVSSKTGEGVAELLVFVSGLAQKFMEKQLESVEGRAKASILEVKDEKGVGKTLDAILYEGVLREGDEILFCSADGSIVRSRVKAILKPKPLDEMRDPRQKFSGVGEVHAAAGIKIACDNAEQAVAGSSLFAVDSSNLSSAEAELRKEVRDIELENEDDGVILKADALGSLEAIVRLLTAEKIPVRRASVGRVTKKDVLEAASVSKQDLFLGVVFAFNVPVEDEARSSAAEEKVRLFEEKVIYSLVENYQAWRQEAKDSERRQAFSRLPLPCKISALERHCFRVSNPAVFGVEVLGGRLRKGARMMNEKGVFVGEVKSIQKDNDPVEEARRGDAVAISMDEPYYGRQVRERMELLTDMGREDVKELEDKYAQALSDEEKDLLQQIKRIKGFQAAVF